MRLSNQILETSRTGPNSFGSYGAYSLAFRWGAIFPRGTPYKSGQGGPQTDSAAIKTTPFEQNILVDVDNDVGQVSSTLQQVDATRAARIYAEDALAAEKKKLENGKSTSFIVLQLDLDAHHRPGQRDPGAGEL